MLSAIFIASFGPLIFSFQNCSKTSFNAVNTLPSVAETAQPVVKGLEVREQSDLFPLLCQDGKAPPCSATQSAAPRDIVIILDSTSSVSSANWGELINSIKTIVGHITSDPRTRYAVIEFGNVKNLTLDSAINNRQLNFLVGSKNAMSSTSADVQQLNASSRKIVEYTYDGVGPAIIRAQDYLNQVGRAGASKEIWAVHDMSCCGFPADGERGTQIQDAQSVKNLGTIVVGIRTLASVASSDAIASPNLAFNVGSNLNNINQFINEKVIPQVNAAVKIVAGPFNLSKPLDKSRLSNVVVALEGGIIIPTSHWTYNDVTNSISIKAEALNKTGVASMSISYPY
jgi:hypothetical protein